MKMTRTLGWHVLWVNGRLGYADGREVIIKKRMRARCNRYGKAISKKPKLCQAGMHACPRVLDAYYYGACHYGRYYDRYYVCRVAVYGVTERDSIRTFKKFVGVSREVLWAVKLNWKECRHLQALANQKNHKEAKKFIYELKKKKGITSGSLAPKIDQ